MAGSKRVFRFIWPAWPYLLAAPERRVPAAGLCDVRTREKQGNRKGFGFSFWKTTSLPGLAFSVFLTRTSLVQCVQGRPYEIVDHLSGSGEEGVHQGRNEEGPIMMVNGVLEAHRSLHQFGNARGKK